MSNRLSLTDAAGGLLCSFCGESPGEGVIVTAPEVAICPECVARAVDLVSAAEDADADSNQTRHGDENDTPHVRVRLLSEASVASLLSMDDVIDTMKAMLPQFSAGALVQPVRSVMPIDEGRGFFGLMPAQLHDPEAVGAKLVTVYPGNADLSLPTHSATVLLFNPRTGQLASVMDGRLITEMRTAAVSALSAVALAREDAAVLAIIGSGVQARSHLEALERVWTFSRVRAWSPNVQHLEAFVAEMAPNAGAPIVAAATAEDAVRGADIVVLATSSVEPVIESDWVRHGAHVISVGACRPDQREIDPVLVARGRLYVDSREAALAESGDVVMGIAEQRFTSSHIVAEIGDVLAGRAEGRRSDRDVTIFKALGLAVEDVAAATLVYQRAVSHDAGVEHDF